MRTIFVLERVEVDNHLLPYKTLEVDVDGKITVDILTGSSDDPPTYKTFRGDEALEHISTWLFCCWDDRYDAP